MSVKSYEHACREYLKLHQERHWSVEQLLVFWERKGGMYAAIAAKLRKEMQ